jgi:pimeloyl-ACP methyl ester carboxylesterase
VDVIGASLGGTLMFMHAVLMPDHRMGSLVSMGSPVRWVKAHPIMKVLFGSPLIAGLLPIRGTRKLAEIGLPLISKHVPWLLSIYINPSSSDVSAAREMVKTVEDPNRFVNKQIAEWLARRDLIIRGRNICDGLRDLKMPLLCIAAIHDGIVPRETAEYPYWQAGCTPKELVTVGDDKLSMAHADMFVADVAHAQVFAPITTFLAKQYPG